MKFKVAHGTSENDIIAGNVYDKYGSSNPLVKWIMTRFDKALSELVSESSPVTIHEVGCGEGYWVLKWKGQGFDARGSDFSRQVISIAKDNAAQNNLPTSIFTVRSIYDLDLNDSADLVVCCEVLEHLNSPEAGLLALKKMSPKKLILSVPREPLWSLLNMARGKYLSDWGNTPGHVQRWSVTEFQSLVAKYFKIIKVKTPLPWTMLLCRPYADNEKPTHS